MGLYAPGAPTELIEHLLQVERLGNFVELGAYKGDTAAWAALHFSRVVTVEAVAELHQRVSNRFKDMQHVEVLLGESTLLLPTICQRCRQPTLFWIDSHWSGGATFGEHQQCPLLDELECILQLPANNLILVDDARFFLAPPMHPLDSRQWPSLSEIVRSVDRLVPTWHVDVIEDVVVISPPIYREKIVEYCQRRLMILEWRWGTYAKFLHSPTPCNVLRLMRVIGGVMLKRAGLLPELPPQLIRDAKKTFGYAREAPTHTR